jgi:hypothetical protein
MHFKKQCFTAAMEVASESDACTVVHGWIPGDKGWIVHAWVEIDAGEGEIGVYDLTLSNKPFGQKAYYEQTGATPQRSKRYDRVDFFTRIAETGGFGPFDKEFFFATTSVNDPLEIIHSRKG